MSTHWFPYCKSCETDEHRVIWWNHGERGVASLIKLMPDLGRFARALRELPHLDIDVRVIGPEWTNGLLDFAAVQGDHEIVDKNEYGQLDGQCRERFQCSAGHWHDCELWAEHCGAHGPKAAR